MLKNRKEKEIKKEKFVLEIDEIVKKKYLNLLGFAARSGKISYGEEDILNGIEKGKIALTLIAKDMSKKSKDRVEKKIINESLNYSRNTSKRKISQDIKVIIVGTKEENSSAVGKINKPIIGIKDRNLAKGIIKSILEEIDGE